MISYYVTNVVVLSELLVTFKNLRHVKFIYTQIISEMIGVEATEVVTTSSERSFQSALKSKRHLVQQSKENKQAKAIVRKNSTLLYSQLNKTLIYLLTNRLKKNVPTVVTTKWNIIPCNYVLLMKVKLSFTTVKNAGKFSERRIIATMCE